MDVGHVGKRGPAAVSERVTVTVTVKVLTVHGGHTVSLPIASKAITRADKT